jgi:hypothetical protein
MWITLGATVENLWITFGLPRELSTGYPQVIHSLGYPVHNLWISHLWINLWITF